MKRPGSKKHGKKRVLGLVLVIGLLTAGTYAFTATNTVASSKAGDGQGTIGFFAITDAKYTPNTAGDGIASVNFLLEDTATTVYAQVLDSAQLSTSGALNTSVCTAAATSLLTAVAGKAEWSCTFALLTQPPTETASFLRVVAYD